MTIANLAHVRVAARLQGPTGDDLINVFMLENHTGGSESYADAMSTIASALDDAYTILNVAVNQAVTYADISFWDMEGHAPMGVVDWPVLATGSENQDLLPSQVAGFVYFRTHKARCLGKKFSPGVSENRSTDGRPNGGYLSVLGGWADEIMNDDGYLTLASWPFVILSSTDGLYYKPYQHLEPSVFSTLRRRRIGRGS